MKPYISVVMPVYNGQRFLREAVESIQNQTFSDFELLILNNASTDNSRQILYEYEKLDNRIRILEQPIRDLTPSLQRGFLEACGRYIARMDSDDIALPDRLEKQVSFLDNHPEIAVLGGQVDAIDDQGNFIRKLVFPLDHDEISEALEKYCSIVHPTVMLRPEAYKAVGGYRVEPFSAEDYDLWLRMSEKFQLANLQDVLLKYRIHGEQVSSTRREKQIVTILGIRAAARLRKAGYSDPISGIDAIDENRIRQWGVTETEYIRFHVEDDLFYSSLLFDSGHHDAAREVISDSLARSPLQYLEPEKVARLCKEFIHLHTLEDLPFENLALLLKMSIKKPRLMKEVIRCFPRWLLLLGGALQHQENGFRALQQGNRASAYKFFRRAVLSNPLCLLNRGVVTTLIRYAGKVKD